VENLSSLLHTQQSKMIQVKFNGGKFYDRKPEHIKMKIFLH